MADIYTTGLITVTNGSTAATGNGTGWALADVLRGDLVLLDGVAEPAIVASVTDDTHLTLLKPWAGTTASDAGYAILPTSWLRTSSSYAADIAERWLAALESSTIAYYGSTPDPDIGEDGQLWLDPESSPWRIWKRVAGAWVEQAAPGGGAPVGAEYLVGAASSSLTAERVVTDTGSVKWDLATAGQAKATVVLSGAVEGRLARWGAGGALGQSSSIYDNGAGNVGIGTTAPESILHFVGGVALFERIENVTSGTGLMSRRSRGTSAVKQALVTGDVVQTFAGVGYDGSGWVNCTNLRTVVDGPVSTGNVPTVLQILTFSAGLLSEKMRVGDAVGIGTTAPTAKLHVAGPIRTDPYTVATLPDAAMVGNGTLAWVTDGATTTRGAVVTGGGGTKLLVGSDGTNWLAL